MFLLIAFGAILSCTKQEPPEKAKEEYQQRLRARNDEFVKMIDNLNLSPEPFIKGKIAVIVKTINENKEFSMEYNPSKFVSLITADLLAKNEAELGSVIMINCKANSLGFYKDINAPTFDGSPGKEVFMYPCDFFIIDLSVGQTITKRYFPSNQLVGNRITVKDETRPIESMMKYLNDLPRQ